MGKNALVNRSRVCAGTDLDGLLLISLAPNNEAQWDGGFEP